MSRRPATAQRCTPAGMCTAKTLQRRRMRRAPQAMRTRQRASMLQTTAGCPPTRATASAPRRPRQARTRFCRNPPPRTARRRGARRLPTTSGDLDVRHGVLDARHRAHRAKVLADQRHGVSTTGRRAVLMAVRTSNTRGRTYDTRAAASVATADARHVASEQLRSPMPDSSTLSEAPTPGALRHETSSCESTRHSVAQYHADRGRRSSPYRSDGCATSRGPKLRPCTRSTSPPSVLALGLYWPMTSTSSTTGAPYDLQRAAKGE